MIVKHNSILTVLEVPNGPSTAILKFKKTGKKVKLLPHLTF